MMFLLYFRENFPLEYKSKKFFNASFASGIMYVRLPEFGEDSFGFGIAFGTMTLGDKFNHLSTSIGFGYSTTELIGNSKKNQFIIYLVTLDFQILLLLLDQSWIFPEGDLDSQLFALSLRFIAENLQLFRRINDTSSCLMNQLFLFQL